MKPWKTKIAVLGAILTLALMAGYLWHSGFLIRGAPSDRLTCSSFPFRLSGPVYFAQRKGFFKEQGLDVTIKSSASSLESVRDLRDGRVDLACCGAFNLTQGAFAGPPCPCCLAVLGTGQAFSLIARRDRGISRPEDLRGKTIGLMGGTAAEFFLGRFLIFYRVLFKEVTLADVKPVKMAEVLGSGKVDALMVPEPINLEVAARMGNAAVTWPSQQDQDIYWILTTREDCLQNKPVALEKAMAALEQAIEFIKHNPHEAREIISQEARFPLAEWDNFPLKYGLFLDQGLLLAMEDQAAWMISNGLTKQSKIPNFLDHLCPGPLLKVNPKAVRLAMPEKEAAR